MELVESIEYINDQLIRLYGNEPYADNQARFRVVFSEDQFEKRWTDRTKDGFQLLSPEVRELPKYRQYIKAKYILERLVPVDERETDLIVKVSYEPLHVFMDSEGKYLPPRLDMCMVVCDSILSVMNGERKVRHYSDPANDPEYRIKMVDEMMKTLFGNETNVTDALAYQSGVTNPAGPEHFQSKADKDE